MCQSNLIDFKNLTKRAFKEQFLEEMDRIA